MEKKVNPDNIEKIFGSDQKISKGTSSFPGNIKFYQVPGGKWKWIYFDLDWASFTLKYNYVKRWLNDEGHGVSRAFNNRLLMALLENANVRDQFLTTVATLMKTNFSNSAFDEKLNAYRALIEPLMPAQFEKWGSSMNSWQNSLNSLAASFSSSDT